MKLKSIITYILSTLLLLFGIMLSFGATLNILKPERDKPIAGDIIGIILLGLPSIILGIYFILRTKKRDNKRYRDELEDKILKLAHENQGKLTVAELAMHTSLTSEEAKEFLDQLCIKNYAELFISESGVIVYKFKMIISDREKKNAERL
jgi:hypothetical protein